MSFGVLLTTFFLVAVAELPDKTMIATLFMAARSKPVPVWLGATAAFALHVVLAVVAGRLLQLLPHKVLETMVTVLFLAGAAYLLIIPEKAEETKGVGEAEGAPLGGRKVFATAFAVILVGEFGDLTQLLIVNLVAKYHQPLSVGVGAFLALTTVAAIGAFAGRSLIRVVPLQLIRRLSGVILLGFAGYGIYSLVTS
jgi:putative Ca2+/H+ antiporter (TMEM165/GDT1 family)